MTVAAGTEATREDLERDEDLRLSPCALRSSRTRRRFPLEREGRIFDYRTEFQRDRDRILHSRAFRRLRLKSPGGAFPPAERYRDRLTHTLEVSQLARTVARGLSLNEDLVEAIALGHELGMPPFGRIGEAVLDALLEGKAGGFRASYQSLRVADLIEKRYDHPGINLTDATREGILKHAAWEEAGGRGAGCLEGIDLGSLRPECAPVFETQVVAVVERTASVVQDLDDGLRAGDLGLDEAEALPIVRELLRRTGRGTGKGRTSPFMRANRINRGLTHLLVTGIIHHSRRSLRAWMKARGVARHDDFWKSRPRIAPDTIGLSPAVRRLYDGLRRFVQRNVGRSTAQASVESRASRLIGELFRALTTDPRLAEDYMLLRFRESYGGPYLRDVAPESIRKEIERRYRSNPRWARIVADHIAGMSDWYAASEGARLVDPFPAGPAGGAR